MSTSQRIDVQSFLNEQPFSGFQWGIFILCGLITMFDGFDTAAIGYIAPSLLKEWGIPKPALAPVLSAALFGLAAGALAAGPLADRFGRRRVLITSVFLFGLASLACATASNINELTMLRFVTGLGLGAAMPNAVTLLSEYCPDARRATLTNAMFCGFPLGASLGGFLAAWMIPHLGWRSVLVLCGVAPVVLGLVLIVFLPESVRFMVARSWPARRIAAVLSRISVTAAYVSEFVMSEKVRTQSEKGGLGLVLSRSYIVGSVALWVTYFMGLVIFYALINWMPVLFGDAGIDPRTGTLIAALFPLGGIGAILFGWLMDRFNGNRLIAVGYALTAVGVFLIGHAAGNVGLLMLTVLCAGTLMNTAQSSMPALAAAFYPTSGRATGVAWMLGIGRFGGIAGSFLVAALSARKLGFADIFLYVAVPGVIAAIALLVKEHAHPASADAEHVEHGAEIVGH